MCFKNRAGRNGSNPGSSKLQSLNVHKHKTDRPARIGWSVHRNHSASCRERTVASSFQLHTMVLLFNLATAKAEYIGHSLGLWKSLN